MSILTDTLIKEMFIDISGLKETSIALTENSNLTDYFTDYSGRKSRVGNIYRGIVRKLDRSLNAAFIDIGLEKHGFLSASDVHPVYGNPEMKVIGLSDRGRGHQNIENLLKEGTHVTVQVLKDPVESKGYAVTTWLSVPGRMTVLLPGLEGIGVSHKIEDETERAAGRKLLSSAFSTLGGISAAAILRTQGLGATKTDLEKDLKYCRRLWDTIKNDVEKAAPGKLIYDDTDNVMRILRDYISADYSRIVCPDDSTAASVSNIWKLMIPRKAPPVFVYTGNQTVFAAFGIEKQLKSLEDVKVNLPSGGYLYIESVKALTAIDVNSGKSAFRSMKSQEAAFRTNLEAVEEAIRQIRLRDIGGIIAIDLIDMESSANKRECERLARELLKQGKQKHSVEKINEFGLLILSRQRTRINLDNAVFEPCSVCNGTGKKRSCTYMGSRAAGEIRMAKSRPGVFTVKITAGKSLAENLVSNWGELFAVSSGARLNLSITDSDDGGYSLEILDKNGRVLPPDNASETKLRTFSEEGQPDRPKRRRSRGKKRPSAIQAQVSEPVIQEEGSQAQVQGQAQAETRKPEAGKQAQAQAQGQVQVQVQAQSQAQAETRKPEAGKQAQAQGQVQGQAQAQAETRKPEAVKQTQARAGKNTRGKQPKTDSADMRLEIEKDSVETKMQEEKTTESVTTESGPVSKPVRNNAKVNRRIQESGTRAPRISDVQLENTVAQAPEKTEKQIQTVQKNDDSSDIKAEISGAVEQKAKGRAKTKRTPKSVSNIAAVDSTPSVADYKAATPSVPETKPVKVAAKPETESESAQLPGQTEKTDSKAKTRRKPAKKPQNQAIEKPQNQTSELKPQVEKPQPPVVEKPDETNIASSQEKPVNAGNEASEAAGEVKKKKSNRRRWWKKKEKPSQ